MFELTKIAIRLFAPRGRRARWLAVVALGLVVAGAEYVTALLVFRVLSAATEGGVVGTVPLGLGVEMSLTTLAVVTASVFALRGVLTYYSNYALERVVQSSGAMVSAQLHRQYLLAPYRFHLSRNSAESMRTALASVDSATLSVARPIVKILTQVPVVIALLVLLLVTSPQLTLAAMVIVGVILSVVLTLVQIRLRRLGRESESNMNDLFRNLRDSFDSIRDVKAYGAEAYFDRLYRVNRNYQKWIRTTRLSISQIPRLTLEFIVVGGLVMVIGVSASTDSLTGLVPVLGLFAYAILRLVPALNETVSATTRLRFGEQAVRNVVEDLEITAIDEQVAPVAEDRPRPSPIMTRSIELAGVSFAYSNDRGERALHSVSLEIRKGEMVAIVGPSGAGKSTLVDILLGMLEPDEGHVLVDGQERSIREWRRAVGFVSQTVVLVDASLRDNVTFGSENVEDHVVIRALERAQLGEWFSSLPDGLDTVVGESGKLISGGQRQRVAIARCLYREPELIVLDEATSDLDNATEGALLAELRSTGGGLTTLIVSHRLAPIKAADRIAMMAGGQVAATGTFTQLTGINESFRDLVGVGIEDASDIKQQPPGLAHPATRELSE